MELNQCFYFDHTICKYSYFYISADCEYFGHLCSFGTRSPDSQLVDSPTGCRVHTCGWLWGLHAVYPRHTIIAGKHWNTNTHIYIIMTSNWHPEAWEIIRLRMQMRDPFSLQFPFACGLLSQSCKRKKKYGSWTASSCFNFVRIHSSVVSHLSAHWSVSSFSKVQPAPPTHATLDGISPTHRLPLLTGRSRILCAELLSSRGGWENFHASGIGVFLSL